MWFWFTLINTLSLRITSLSTKLKLRARTKPGMKDLPRAQIQASTPRKPIEPSLSLPPTPSPRQKLTSASFSVEEISADLAKLSIVNTGHEGLGC